MKINHSRSKTISSTLLSALVISCGLHAETATNAVSEKLFVERGGYTNIKVDTNLEQKFPLLQVKTLELPSSIKYIGQSLNYILSLSGYSLAPLSETEDSVLNLYSLRLPITNRSFSASTTLQIVQTIVGVGFEVNINEIARTISIEPRNGIDE